MSSVDLEAPFQLVLIEPTEVDPISLAPYQHNKQPIMAELINCEPVGECVDQLTQEIELSFEPISEIHSNISLSDGSTTMDLMMIRTNDVPAFKAHFEALCDRFNSKLSK